MRDQKGNLAHVPDHISTEAFKHIRTMDARYRYHAQEGKWYLRGE